ncbi:hypothetical protein D1BOALGB6SA_1348 [Olavius sp. associated proteobacterium Delta 1]|nr:hypothetical protein D1BOALGB6SA_1348 [Olavius sp. associated proteobacterium Delta 1]
MRTDTMTKNIVIISVLTIAPNITAIGVTIVIIDISRITGTLINTGAIINPATICIGRLKNTGATAITVRSTAVQTVTCRFWLRHLIMDGR